MTPIHGLTVAMPPSASTVKDDWRPLAAGVLVCVAVLLGLWRFGGGSLQTTGATGRRPAAAPPQASAAPPPVPAPIAAVTAARGGPKPAAPPPTRGTVPAQPPLASIIPGAPAGGRGSRPPAETGTGTDPSGEKPRTPALPAVFEARVLARDGDSWREHDCRILLADGKIHVHAADDSPTMPAIAFDDVVAIAYSRGRDPMWNAPGGPEQIAKAGGGAFGIFRGTRHWVTVRTTSAKSRFLVLRLGNDAQAKHAITLLEARTGRHAQTVAGADTR
jgi:hypothetical protein